MLDGLANEYYLTGQIEEAIAPCVAALTIWRALDYTEKVGLTLCRLSRINWLGGRNAEAEQHGRAAVAALETLPPGRELALAYGNLAHLGTRSTDSAEALYWGERAIALAERLGDHETLCYALNSMGAAEIESGYKGAAEIERGDLADEDVEKGRAKLERSLAIALEHGFEEHVARAYANLSVPGCTLQYPQAQIYLRDGIAYYSERDLQPRRRVRPGCRRARAWIRAIGSGRKKTPLPS
jgi:tetratricopeptide (TPR) repeat protein